MKEFQDDMSYKNADLYRANKEVEMKDQIIRKLNRTIEKY